MKEAENASIFFGFENVFVVGNLKSFHIVKVSFFEGYKYFLSLLNPCLVIS